MTFLQNKLKNNVHPILLQNTNKLNNWNDVLLWGYKMWNIFGNGVILIWYESQNMFGHAIPILNGKQIWDIKYNKEFELINKTNVFVVQYIYNKIY
jgi:hypothetical protein